MARIESKKTDLIWKMIETMNNGNIFCSFEISPPKNSTEIRNVLKSVDMIKQECDPLFFSITWHLRDMPGTANDLIPHVFDLASSMHNNEILLHIAATGLTKKAILDISSAAVALGIRNFFALRGDRKWDMENDDFPHAVHLVQFLRKHFGRNIVICVAGYPGGHPESPSHEDDLKYLKEKVDAGVDFIITQILYEARAFEHFVDDCRNIGITVPIIAGIMPIKDYASLQSISKLCHLKVPKAILETLEPIRHNDDLVQSYGISYITDMAKQILSSKRASGIHFFTMNREETAMSICKNLGFGNKYLPKSLPIQPVVEREMRLEEK